MLKVGDKVRYTGPSFHPFTTGMDTYVIKNGDMGTILTRPRNSMVMVKFSGLEPAGINTQNLLLVSNGPGKWDEESI